MSSTRPTLTLQAGANEVPRARQMVGHAFHTLGRPDLVDSAELGVSELVTNALLHVGGRVEVRVGGTIQHPRVEVKDSSPLSLSLADVARAAVADETPDGIGDDRLLSVGRGLRIVSRCSDAWGVDLEERGKVVWFSPARQPQDSPVPGTVSGVDHVADDAAATTEGRPVLLVDVPVDLHLAFRQHFRELSREIRLLALAHSGSYPVAAELADVFVAADRWMRTGLGDREVDAARAAGETYVDLHLVLPQNQMPLLVPLREGLLRADVFCLQVDLLTLARTPEQVEFAAWLLGELERQADGGRPRAWRSGPSGRRRGVRV